MIVYLDLHRIDSFGTSSCIISRGQKGSYNKIAVYEDDLIYYLSRLQQKCTVLPATYCIEPEASKSDADLCDVYSNLCNSFLYCLEPDGVQKLQLEPNTDVVLRLGAGSAGETEDTRGEDFKIKQETRNKKKDQDRDRYVYICCSFTRGRLVAPPLFGYYRRCIIQHL